jgi:precorrin-3B synthase
MPAKDGLLIRLRPPGGTLSSAQLKALALSCAADGNGLVDLTGQARLQVRGLSSESLPKFTASMVEAGLADPNPEYELRRRVTLLHGGDASLAAALEAALIAAPIAFAEKFDVVVGRDDGPNADIMLHQGRLWLASAVKAASCADPLQAVLHIAAALNGRRVREVDVSALYDAAALQPDSAIPAPETSISGIGLLFGAMKSATLLVLAELGEAYGDGTWHLTRSRSLILGAVRSPVALMQAAEAQGFMTAPTDPGRRVFACPGVLGCESATNDTRQAAQMLLAALPEGRTLHVSGCSKGCAYPQPADFTFVGTHSGYDLVRNGRAKDVALVQGLQLAAARAHMLLA